MFKYVGEKVSSVFKKTMAGIFYVGGYIPKSVAIIMDGNRRYAQKKHVEKIKGHEDGMTKLLQVLLWCIDLGIKELTVFAFSIDNFNRSKEEFDALMNLIKEKFSKLSEKNEFMNKYGVKICIYGNVSFFDNEIREILNKIERDTEGNDNIKLNVCLGYNSTEEIYQTKLKTIDQLKGGTNSDNKLEIEIDKKNEFDSDRKDQQYSTSEIINKFESNLYGGYNCNPDILVRTSGEVRLSNFLSYQCRFSMIFFVDKFWPEFSFLDFMKILLRYNIDYSNHTRKLKELEKINSFPHIFTSVNK
jgi:ditrans,polycis-polyprenyl diphosphate synthase